MYSFPSDLLSKIVRIVKIKPFMIYPPRERCILEEVFDLLGLQGKELEDKLKELEELNS